MLAGVTQNQGTPVLRVLDAWGCPILWHICRRKAWRLWSMRRYRWRVISFVVPSNFLDHFWGSFSNFHENGTFIFFLQGIQAKSRGFGSTLTSGSCHGMENLEGTPPESYKASMYNAGWPAAEWRRVAARKMSISRQALKKSLAGAVFSSPAKGCQSNPSPLVYIL
jgi:hypothetical protein